jgi:hypothetical protein
MNLKAWPSLIWHAPGRMWAGMLRAGSLATWMQWGAGVSATAIAIGFMLIIWRGPWPDSAASQRLDLLGQGQLMAWVTILVALAAIAGLRLAFSANKDGFRGGVERDDDDAPPSVKVETVTTTQITEDPKP